MLRKVAIVETRGWGRVEAADYREFIDLITGSLEKAEDSQGKPAAEVKVTSGIEDALTWLGGPGTMVFISRGDLDTAKKVASQHPKIRVILFTGLIPEGEVVLFSKTWIKSAKTLNQVILTSWV